MQLRTTSLVVAVIGATLSHPVAARAQAPHGRSLSLDSLLNIRISAAARYEQTAREAPASISVVTREDIDLFGYRSVGEVVASLQGFYLTDDRTFLSLGVRGFGRPSDNNNRVMLLVDGQRWNDIFNGEAVVGRGLGVPIEAVERVEIVRGPGSTMYGSSAMLAVVNVITRRAHRGDAVEVTGERGDLLRRGTATFSTSPGAGLSVSGYAAWRDEDVGDLYYPEFDDPLTNNGVVPGSDSFDGSSFGLSVERKGFDFTASMDVGDLVDPTAPYQSSFATAGSTRHTYNHYLGLRYRGTPTPNVAVEARAFEHRVVLEGRFDYDAPLPDRIFDLDGAQWGGEVGLTFDPSPRYRIIAGAEYGRVDPRIVVGTDQGALEVGAPINVGSAFMLNEVQALPNLSVVIGIRADRYSTVGSAISPRGALVFHPGEGTTLKFLYGEAFRAPTPLEQFIHQPPILKVNPSLGPERIRTAELVWEQRITEGLHASVSAYDYRMSDLISQGQDPTDGVLTYLNLDRIRGRGVGAEIMGRWGRSTLFANATYQNATAADETMALANSPSLLIRAGAASTLTWGGSLGGTVLRDGRRGTLRGGTTDAYTLVKLNVRSPKIGPAQAEFSILNALDAKYWHPGGLEHRQRGLPQEGRTFRLTLSASF